jgi:hypothetical protein
MKNPKSKANKKKAITPVGSGTVLGQRELELLNYLHQQFPATIGHIPLAEKIHAVWQAGMLESINIIRERARLLSANGCKDTIREHYAEQAIRSAAWPNEKS